MGKFDLNIFQRKRKSNLGLAYDQYDALKMKNPASTSRWNPEGTSGT